ncbi:MAG: mechanosensitive ion channel [Kofleriaceae bacterium]|nr:MAG: mechanosensitive ion channel [Kofleriaceae bacterium]MBZ0238555.1 mechanosensitive ion channel family protein [Kofleriaceae bacterium]
MRVDALLAPVEVFGVRLVGVNAESGRKLLLSIALVVGIWLIRRLVRALVSAVVPASRHDRVRFWLGQAVSLACAVIVAVGLVSLWFDDPVRLTTALGLVTAGLAFALQRVVTALAGYVVIMRGRTFGIGDRIVMGGVRGDVVALDFTQTTIMEMGQPPPVQNADPAMWVRSRQYTGRVVTVSNAKVFDEPVYNYTRDFPYLWEELTIPLSYATDRTRAEAIVLDVAARHTQELQRLGDADRAELLRRFDLRNTDLSPRAYFRLTDNWIELTVRFIALDHAVRELKDAIGRELLAAFEAADIRLGSATFEIVGLPTVHAALEPAHGLKRRPV